MHFLPNSQAVYQYSISISLQSQNKCLPDSLLFPLFPLVLAESIAATMFHISNHNLPDFMSVHCVHVVTDLKATDYHEKYQFAFK